MIVARTYLVLLLLVTLPGCQSWNLGTFDFDVFDFQSKAAAKDAGKDDEFETTVKTPLIGEYTTVAGLNLITLQGVGLVTGLNGTGGDPPPSMYRTKLLNEMKKRGVRQPKSILLSPTTALVVVRAYLPPLVQKRDHFDIEIRLPANSEATSLNGGWLMETVLSEQALVPGQGVLKGHVYAKAKGPILISTGEGDRDSLAGVLRRGRVVGGGVSLKNRNMSLFLRNDFRSVRNSGRISKRIGERFYHYDEHGIRIPLSEAKTDQNIELKILPKYKDNYPRYIQVIRNMAFRETEVARRVRMQKLEQQLKDPATSERAALQLEAIGSNAAPVLKTGLNSSSQEVRFHAAVALAYLEEPDGLEVLAESARDEPAFRVFALAAMATVNEIESRVLLRELMHEPSAETRYGAFRALSTIDKNDPFIRGEKLNEEFSLHVLDTNGPPMVHLTNRRKAEIVLFGKDQSFRLPMAVRAGNHILVTAPAGGDSITVSRYEVGMPDRKKTVSTRVADVIRTVAEFGGSYPDIAQMLAQAEHQSNASGRIEIDALPRAGRYYDRSRDTFNGKSKRRARIGNKNLVPNLYRLSESSKSDEEPHRKSKRADVDDSNTDSDADAAAKKSGESDEDKNRTGKFDSTGSDEGEEKDSDAIKPAKDIVYDQGFFRFFKRRRITQNGDIK